MLALPFYFPVGAPIDPAQLNADLEALANAIVVAADPSVEIGLTKQNGIAITYARSDSAPAINQAITPIWTAYHTFTAGLDFSDPAAAYSRATMGTGGLLTDNVWTGSNTFVTRAPGTSNTQAATTAFVAAAMRSYLTGLTLSAAGGTGTFGIAAGAAASSDNAAQIVLASAFTKTTGAWAVGTGNGALDVGTIANNTWYSGYAIRNPTSGATDVLISQAPGTSSTVTITIASPGVVTWTAHGLAVGAPVIFTTTGALPTGLVAATRYFVQSVVSANQIQVSATQGGAAINTTGTQSGVHTAASTPLLPAGFTQYRRIGSMLTDGSAQWVAFTQAGDQFLWSNGVLDVNGVTLGTTSTLYTLTVPTGLPMTALGSAWISNAGAVAQLLVTSPAQATQVAGTPTHNATVVSPSAGNGAVAPIQTRTNTSAQIRAVADTASSTFYLTTQGWIDRRGRDE